MSQRRPRVLHIGKFYPPSRGGMERVLANLCQATRHRIDNRVLAFSETRRTTTEVVDGIPVTRVGAVALARSTPIAPAMLRVLRAIDADLIVLHEPNPWALVALNVVRPRVPLAIYYHSEVVRPALQYALFYEPWARGVYRRAARIIVASPAMAQHARALRPYQDRIAVIPFGIDTAAWQLTTTIDRRVAEIRASRPARPLVVFAGRMVPYKGCDVLLRALAGTGASAVLAGDGPVRQRLVALARDLRIDDRVAFPGSVPHEELVALYHAADLFVLPSISRAEAFGFVQVEAMACGTPVISTRLPTGVPWVNQHGVTGMVVEPRNVEALRSAIVSLLGDRDTLARMGAAGQRRVAKEFTLARMGERAAALFESLARG